ncbi:MAG TPA: hypothetical protein VGO06_07970, partial [Bosea sp. (in: a-proteobacteria)]|uniref:hypothetical protein n=1 Tax=Bosea sp. (in: a-proteobacteria) TaxID=1871050 RepID=UPI002E160C1D|nr:hypothetical protein [Bosea sp. (in: a-proteobacteria)]
YGRMAERIAALNTQTQDLRRERRALEAAIASDTSPKISPTVAALLGDKPTSIDNHRGRLADIRSELADIETALVIAERRKREFETAASKAICNAARPEMEKRMTALLIALEAVAVANREVNDIVLAVEAEGASPGSLGPVRAHFLGDPRDADSPSARFVREARGTGYVN